MHDAAIQPTPIQTAHQSTKVLNGAVHFLNRTIPIIFEDKEFFMRLMWHE